MKLLVLISVAITAMVFLALPSASAPTDVLGDDFEGAPGPVSRQRRGCDTVLQCGYDFNGNWFCRVALVCSFKRSANLLDDVTQGNATPKEVFDFLDKDSDGNISVCEWMTVDHGALSVFFNLITDHDMDGNEMISFAEFKTITLVTETIYSTSTNLPDYDNGDEEGAE